MADIISRFIADPAVSTIITVVVAGAIALWLLAAMWVHGDAERRTGSELAALASAGWVLLSSPLLLPLSLAAYALVRPAEPAAERRARELTSTFVADSLVAASCPECGGLVDGSWRRCPTCAAWLAAPCVGCGRWSDVELASCPWCGEADRDRPIVQEPSPLEVSPFSVPRQPLTSAVGALVAGLSGPQPAPPVAATVAAARTGDRRAASAAGRDRGPDVQAPPRQPRTRLRSLRTWQRRTPGGRTRSTERASGGHAGARPRP